MSPNSLCTEVKTVSEEAKDLVRRWCEEVFNQQDLTVCDAIMADRYIEHAMATFGQTAPGEVHGPEHMRTTARWLLDQFPDLRMNIEAIIADGDTVAVRVGATGTNLGPLGGMAPPTGKSFLAGQTHWFRIANGKLAEHWATRDDLTAMLQLGVVQPPGPPSPNR
jgi:predicted ester cyclase